VLIIASSVSPGLITICTKPSKIMVTKASRLSTRVTNSGRSAKLAGTRITDGGIQIKDAGIRTEIGTMTTTGATVTGTVMTNPITIPTVIKAGQFKQPASTGWCRQQAQRFFLIAPVAILACCPGAVRQPG
jgi:hypothetical protein